MRDRSSPTDLYRFPCPNCKKVLKARTRWAGHRGNCPNCHHQLVFPPYTPPNSQSRTAKQLHALIGEDDNITVDEADSDRLSMLLSLATCRDFLSAKKLLAGRPLSAGQWRRLLSSAAVRESMRTHIEQQLERLAEIPDDDTDPAALIARVEETNPDAWKVMTRFLYFLRHGQCEKCLGDPTGLSCIYLTFEAFLDMRKVSAERAQNWQKICHHHLGL